MPEVIKYERIQTADSDVHVERNESSPDSTPDSPTTHVEMPRKRFKFSVAQTTAATLILILIYFCLSIGLTFYQRWLVRDFKYPLFVVLIHLVIKLLISQIIRIAYRLITGRSRIDVDWKSSVTKLAPTGMASGIDIGFSNWGLELVTVSLYTMTKSTTIVFILIFAIVLGLERRSWSTLTIVISISVGLCLFTYKSTEFSALGFCFLLFASIVSGLRWTFAQLIMQKSNLGLHNPVDMVYHMQPWMILSILPFTCVFEGHRLYDAWMQIAPEDGDLINGIAAKIIGGAFIAFCMELSEFLVLSFTSSLTLAVAGIFKEICVVVLAVTFNGDILSPTNVVGLVFCLGGICCHVGHKYANIIRNGKRAGIAESLNGNATIDQIDDGDEDVGSVKPVRLNLRNGQNIPLLDQTLADSDSDDPTSPNNQTSSDIIFDVLKRRDARR